MTTGALLERIHQLELRGMLLGEGTPYHVLDWNPYKSADNRTTDAPRPQRHGLAAGDDYLGERTLDLEVLVKAPTAAALGDYLAALGAAFGPADAGPVPLAWWAPNGKRYIEAKSFRIAPGTVQWQAGTADVVCTAIAPDPRIYSGELHSGSIGLPTSTGGRTYPRTYPMTYGSSGTLGQLELVNAGTAPSPRWQARIDGPVDNPSIVRVDTGQRIDVLASLAAGEFLLIAGDEHTVLLGGTTSRYSWLATPPGWFELEPGSTELRFAAGTSSTGALLTVEWRDAWWL